MATVTGLFDNAADAQNAVEGLIAAGWTRDDISAVVPGAENPTGEVTSLGVLDAEKGAVVGGLAGLFLGLTELAVPGVGLLLIGGWLAAALLGAGVGAATGGLVGLLIDAGVSHEAASHFAEGVRQGRSLITVKTEPTRTAEAAGVLRIFHAIRIESQTDPGA